eukprot:362702-Rhodomonas_salina.1
MRARARYQPTTPIRDPRYLPTQLLCDVQYCATVFGVGICLRGCYAVSGTEVAYDCRGVLRDAPGHDPPPYAHPADALYTPCSMPYAHSTLVRSAKDSLLPPCTRYTMSAIPLRPLCTISLCTRNTERGTERACILPPGNVLHAARAGNVLASDQDQHKKPIADIGRGWCVGGGYSVGMCTDIAYDASASGTRPGDVRY